MLVVVAAVPVAFVKVKLAMTLGEEAVEDAKSAVWNHSGVVVARVVVPYVVEIFHRLLRLSFPLKVVQSVEEMHPF